MASSGAADYDLLIVSDLHLSEGWHPVTRRVHRSEDFLHDDAFGRFLAYYDSDAERRNRRWRLIINGDFVDFLQVTSLPKGEALQEIERVKGRPLSENERRYGPGTTPEETAWKLEVIYHGHRRFVNALAWFVARGNRLTIVRGNHDVELHWPLVQQRFVDLLCEAYADLQRATQDVPNADLEAFRAGVEFLPWFYYEPGLVFVEHGNQCDEVNSFTCILEPVLPHHSELIELPLGSLFVRYMFNQLEDIHPFADNTKPHTRYITWLVKTHPFLAIALLFRQGRLFLNTLGKSGPQLSQEEQAAQVARHQALLAEEAQRWGLASALVQQLDAMKAAPSVRSRRRQAYLMVVEPLAKVVGAIWHFLPLAAVLLLLVSGIVAGALALGLFVVAFAIPVVRSLLSRSTEDEMVRKPYLYYRGAQIHDLLEVRYTVFGHDHRAEAIPFDQAEPDASGWYFNTGTWTPVWEEQVGITQLAERPTFLKITRERADHSVAELLWWNDAAGAPEWCTLRQ